MEECMFRYVCVMDDIAETVASNPFKAFKATNGVVSYVANRRHIWNEAAMGVFNKKAR